MADGHVIPKEYEWKLQESLRLTRLGRFDDSKRCVEQLAADIDRDTRNISPLFKVSVFTTLASQYLDWEQVKAAFQYLDRAFRLHPYAAAPHRCVLYMLFDYIPRFRGKGRIRAVAAAELEELRRSYAGRKDFAAELLLAVISWVEEKPEEMELHLIEVAQEHGILDIHLLLYHAYCCRLRGQHQKALGWALEFWKAIPQDGLCVKFMLETCMDFVVDALRDHDHTVALEQLSLCQDLVARVAQVFGSDETGGYGVRLYLRDIQCDLPILDGIVRVDIQIAHLFQVRTLQEFSHKAAEIATLVPAPADTSELLQNLCYCKHVILALTLEATTGRSISTAAERERVLERSRRLCNEMKLAKGKQAIDAVENFVQAVHKNRELSEERRKSDQELLMLFRPAYVLAAELTQAVAAKHKAELFKADLIGSVQETIKEMLTRPGAASGTDPVKVVSKTTPYAPYATMWTNVPELAERYMQQRVDTNGIALTREDVDRVNNHRPAIEVFIVDHGEHQRTDARGEVCITGESREITKYEYRVLYYLLTHAGQPHGRTVADLFQHCWFENTDALRRGKADRHVTAKVGNKIRDLVSQLRDWEIRVTYEKRHDQIHLSPWPSFCVLHVIQGEE